MESLAPNVLTIPIDLGGIWHYGWTFGLCFCAIVSYHRITKRNPLVFLTVCYFLCRAFWTIEAPLLPYGDYTRAFQATAGQMAIELVFILSAIGSLDWDWIPECYLAPSLVLIESLFVWFNHAGLLGWESFDGALIALCLPAVTSPFIIALGLATILTHHGTTAFLILWAESCVFWPRWAFASLWAAVGLAFYHHHGPYLDGIERLKIWRDSMLYWASDWKFVLFGTGAGSFQWISLLLRKFQPPLFLQMHNDWLQILFEFGAVGFACVVGIYVRAIKRARNDKVLLAQVIGVGVFGLTYHPLRFFPSAFVVAYLIGVAQRKR